MYIKQTRTGPEKHVRKQKEYMCSYTYRNRHK